MYEWLCYSPSKVGGFCLVCVLFGDDLCSKRNQLRHLLQIPFTPSSDSTRRLEKHFRGGDQYIHKRCCY